jgi:hypothetical protein
MKKKDEENRAKINPPEHLTFYQFHFETVKIRSKIKQLKLTELWVGSTTRQKEIISSDFCSTIWLEFLNKLHILRTKNKS